MKATPEQKRVGVWIRVSTEDQVRGESPEHHEQRARYYAEAKGWQIIEVYRLDAVSGKTVKETPEAKRMLEDVRNGRITGLIFSKLARLARNTKELLEFSDFFREHNADLISLAESIDTSSPAGRLFYTIIAAMAQWEREEIAARVAASVPIRARLGKSTGGQAPFGYQWKDKKLIPNPEEAPVRRLMYELFKEHRRKKTVARELNERGFRTRDGSKFSDTTVDRLLRDPTAKGIRRANYTKSQGNGKSWTIKPESEWVLHEVEAVVSEAVWDECNAILAAQKAKGKRPTRKTVQLFAGRAYCFCGAKMSVPSNSPKYICSKCRTKIPVADLEAIFHERIRSFLSSPEEISEQLNKASAEIQEREELLEVMRKEAGKLAADVEKLHELYLAGSIDQKGFGDKYHPIAARRRTLEEEIPRLQAEIDIRKINHISSEDIVSGARDLHSHWSTFSHDEKWAIVEAITDRIVVHKDEIELHLLYEPNPSTPSSSPIPPQNGGMKATEAQGFIAAKS